MALALLAAGADPLAVAREQVLAVVNKAREEHGLAPLTRDSLLERVGTAFCRKLLAEGGSGHFASDGVPPYLRYLLVGGTGFHRENVGSYTTTGELQAGDVPSLAVELTASMLAETPPADGHRRTLLAPFATHMGVGVAFSAKRLVLTHEVATELSEVTLGPVICQARSPWSVVGRVRLPWQAAAVEVLWEPLPGTGPIPGGHSYSYPPRKAWFEPREFLPGSRMSIPGALSIQPGGRFAFRTTTGPHPGVELAVLWGRRPGFAELEPVALAGCVVAEAVPPTLADWMRLREDAP
ncbi:MAG: CAP domain-containing protein [Thermoanaerobaculum sp.]